MKPIHIVVIVIVIAVALLIFSKTGKAIVSYAKNYSPCGPRPQRVSRAGYELKCIKGKWVDVKLPVVDTFGIMGMVVHQAEKKVAPDYTIREVGMEDRSGITMYGVTKDFRPNRINVILNDTMSIIRIEGLY